MTLLISIFIVIILHQLYAVVPRASIVKHLEMVDGEIQLAVDVQESEIRLLRHELEKLLNELDDLKHQVAEQENFILTKIIEGNLK